MRLKSVAALMLASVAGVWLTSDLRAVPGRGIVEMAAIAAGVAGYCEWRENLRRRRWLSARTRRVP